MKTKLFKKTLAIFFTLLMILSIVPISTVSAENVTDDGFQYSIENNEVTITDYVSMTKEVIIPDTIEGCPVKVIGEKAFFRCSSITSVVIPYSVVAIGDSAFNNCESLTSVTIPDSVTSIGAGAFANCGYLTDLTIPKNITAIANGTFSYCVSLENVTIPDGVVTIGSNAFNTCASLTSITIPDSVTSIGIQAFSFCKKLDYISVGENNTVYDSRENCNAVIETATNTLMIASNNTTIPNGITAIGNYAFSGRNSLTYIYIPESVTSIGLGVVQACKSLSDVYYSGTKEQWEAIDIDKSNELLLNKTIHFESGLPTELTDTVTGIKVFTTDNAELMITEITDTASLDEANLQLTNASATKIYNIKLTSSGDEVQPDDAVTVRIPADNENFKVYGVEADGTLTDTKAEFVDGYMMFATEHLGAYVLAEVKVTESTPSTETTVVETSSTAKETLPVGNEAIVTVAGEEYSAKIGDKVTYTCNMHTPDKIEEVDADVYFESDVLKVVSISAPQMETPIISTLEDRVDLSSFDIFAGMDFRNNEEFIIIEFEVVGAGCSDINISINDMCELNGDSYVMGGEIVHEDVYWSESIAVETPEVTDPEETTESAVVTDPAETTTESAVVTDPAETTTESAVVTDPEETTTESAVVTEPVETTTEATEATKPAETKPSKPTTTTTESTKPVETTTQTTEVTEPSKPANVITDNKTQITVETEKDEDVELNVVEIVNEEKIEEIDLILVGEKTVKVFDITLTSNGVEVQPDGKVTVRIPVGIANAKIYRMETDGTLTDMNAVYKDGYLEFTTEHFSIYVVAEPDNEATTDEPVADKGILGDVNCDGKVNIKDATMIQKAAAKIITLSDDEAVRANVNGDKKVNVKDATAIQKFVAKIEINFPIGEQIA